MAFKGILLALVLIVIAVVNAATSGFDVTNVPANVKRGITSDRIFITAADNVEEASVTVTAVFPEDVSVTPSTFTFTPTVRSLSFTVTSNVAESREIKFTVSSDVQFFAPDTITIVFVNRTFDWDSFDTETTYVNEWSEPKRIWLDTPSSSALTFTPFVGNDSVVFNPSSIVIPAGSRSANFYIMSDDEITSDELTWVISGAEAYMYSNSLAPVAVGYDFALRPFFRMGESLSKNVLVGYTGTNGFYVYTPHLPNKTFTVTPQAADTIFTPTSATFGPEQQSVLFSFNTQFPGNREVYLFTNGEGALDYELNPLPSSSINVPKRQVGITIASQHVITNYSYMTVSLSAPVVTELIVSFSAANLRFNVSDVRFTPTGNLTSYTVAFQASNFGADTITFDLSGADAANYARVPAVSIPAFAIEQANFIFADDFYPSIADLYVNVRSERIPIRASISPISEVILQPTAPGLIFEPAQISFKNGSEQQYFTIFPTYSSSYETGGRADSYETTITWLVIGKDAPSYAQPDDITVTVQPRSFQAVWSAHLQTDQFYTSEERHLHKTYKVWVSTNYIQAGEHVSLTPVSPFFKFSPSVIFFDGKANRMELEATLTGIPAGKSVRIDYVIGGKDGGLYTPMGSEEYVAALRPLDIVAAVVSPDERNKGIYIADRPNVDPMDITRDPYVFNPEVLTNYHVSSFLIRSFVLPDQDLTIVPSSPHLKFSPSKITIKARNAVKRIDWQTQVTMDGGADDDHRFNVTGVYLEANFTVKALAPGTHVVKFDLQGADKDYYRRLPHTEMTFRLVSRPDSEPFKVSSSSFLFPSFVVVAVMAAFALVL